MPMSFYENYLSNCSHTPIEQYRDLQQAVVNDTWENGTLATIVGEETSHGSFEFSEVEVWKNTISEFTTNIVRDEKDYRRLMFKEQNKQIERGRFYKFDNNYWIVYDPTSDIEAYAEVYVRKCNNYLKWIDRETGVIYSVPCVLDAEVSSPSPRVTKAIALPNGHIVCWVQGNEITRKIKKNQRFIFSGADCYKFTSYNAYLQEDYVDENVNMIYMDLYLDEIQPSDDLENCIANRYEVEYALNILQSDITQVKNFSGQLTANVLYNGDIIEDKSVRWVSLNDNVIVDSLTGNYTLIGEAGSQGKIKAYMADNPNIYDEITINIEDSIVAESELVIEPLYTEVSQGETITFSVNVYINGAKQTDIVNVVAENLDSSYYELTVGNNNTFALFGKRISVIPLILTFTSGDLTKTVMIELKSLF